MGAERFDDPQHAFGVLYAGEARLTCFLETLALFRPDLKLLRQLGPHSPAKVPEGWERRRRIGRFLLAPGQRWLDLRAVETHTFFRPMFSELLKQHGLLDFDASTVTGGCRPLTQALSAWAKGAGFQGIVYPSRHNQQSCWAIFEGAELTEKSHEAISREDEEFREAAVLLGLQLPS
jgi:hypothetical protein